MRPRRPYETRSPSSTCAGSPLPSRPATNLTSGAYVRIRRSRTARSRVLRNDCHGPRPSPRRRRGDQDEDGGEDEEEDAERVPLLHAASLLCEWRREPTSTIRAREGA